MGSYEDMSLYIQHMKETLPGSGEIRTQRTELVSEERELVGLQVPESSNPLYIHGPLAISLV